MLNQELLGILAHLILFRDILGQGYTLVSQRALEANLLLHPLLLLFNKLAGVLFSPLLALISHLVIPD